MTDSNSEQPEVVATEASIEGPPPLDNYELHYQGNLVGKIEGQIVGPNAMGEYFTICKTTYDSESDRTTAKVRFTNQKDVEAQMRRDGDGHHHPPDSGHDDSG